VPVPNYDDGERDRVLMEPFAVKGVLKSWVTMKFLVWQKNLAKKI
jgi:hypothetical protein